MKANKVKPSASTWRRSVDDFDPYLTLQRADGTTLVEDDDSGGGLNARIAPFIVPVNGRYLVKTLRPATPLSTAPYTLTFALLTPPELVPGKTASSSTKNDMLWTFNGRAGQIVNISLDDADPGFDPYLTLRGADGGTLAEDDNSGGELNARIRGVILLADGTYFVQVGQPDSGLL